MRLVQQPEFDPYYIHISVEGGDWWRTDFFFNITVAELIGDKLLNTPRVQELIDIMHPGANRGNFHLRVCLCQCTDIAVCQRQINTTWYINAISDGQRRRCCLAGGPLKYVESIINHPARCQLLECLAEEKKAPATQPFRS